MRKAVIGSVLIIFGNSFQIQAQSLNNEDIRAQFIQDWERAKAYTVDYLNTVPADKYFFKATDSIRTFAQHMLHLAQSSVNIMAPLAGMQNVTGEKILEERKTAQTKDSVMYWVVTSYDFFIRGLKTMDMTALNKKVKLYNWEETTYAWLLKAFEHQTHHRAQTTIYIRLLGLHPPQERLF